MRQETGNKLENGDIAGGLADTAALVTQTALGIKAPTIMRGAGRLTEATGAGIKAATPGLINGAGNIALGAGLGELLGELPGPTGSAFRYIGAVRPIFRGTAQIGSALSKGFKAGRASLFPPPVAPGPLPAIGDEAAQMYAAQQARLNSQATAPTATTGASTVPQPPPEALARLNSQVTVNPRAATALFNEMQSSGSVPPTARPGQPYGGEQPPPDRFVQAARQARATGTEQLADALRAAGVSSSRLSTVTPDEWALFAKNTGVSWPIGRPAQLAWIKDTIAAIRQREGVQ